MLNFLVKIATYLDSKGEYKLAKEIDSIVDKLAQSADVVGPRGTLQRERPVEDEEVLSSIIDKIGIMALNQAMDPSADAPQSAEQMTLALSNAMGTTEMPASLKPSMNQLLARLNMLSSNKNNTANPMTNVWQEVAKYSQAAKNALMQGAKGSSNKAKSRKPNALVSQVQTNLGMKPTGYWDPDTNAKFIAMMNSSPQYAKYMKDGKFQGTLQQAVQFTMQLAELNKQEAPPQENIAEKAPAQAAAPAPTWKSKWHQMTPAAFASLAKFEQYRPGQGQTLIEAIDKVPHQTQQDFEEYLKSTADDASDQSGVGRLNDSYRRQ